MLEHDEKHSFITFKIDTFNKEYSSSSIVRWEGIVDGERGAAAAAAAAGGGTASSDLKVETIMLCLP